MKTVKRKAKIGEKVIVTNADKKCNDHKIGDIFIVFEREDAIPVNSGIIANKRDCLECSIHDDMIFLYDNQYEVIEEELKRDGKVLITSTSKEEYVIANISLLLDRDWMGSNEIVFRIRELMSDYKNS